MDHRLPATLEMAREFSQLFVNRRAYTIQSMRPHAESGRHYYYRPKPKDSGEPVELTIETVRRHLAGEITIGIYAINAATQRCKWMAIDADYKTALEDLIKVQRQLQNDRIEAALEKSRRGGHLWIFFERPVLAREARVYIYHVAGKLGVQVKGTGLADGIEIFPKQDELRREEFGNAIRAPLGVHWGAREGRGWRYWFYGADYKLEDQLTYLKGIGKVKEEHLRRMIAGTWRIAGEKDARIAAPQSDMGAGWRRQRCIKPVQGGAVAQGIKRAIFGARDFCLDVHSVFNQLRGGGAATVRSTRCLR